MSADLFAEFSSDPVADQRKPPLPSGQQAAQPPPSFGFFDSFNTTPVPAVQAQQPSRTPHQPPMLLLTMKMTTGVISRVVPRRLNQKLKHNKTPSHLAQQPQRSHHTAQRLLARLYMTHSRSTLDDQFSRPRIPGKRRLSSKQRDPRTRASCLMQKMILTMMTSLVISRAQTQSTIRQLQPTARLH
jgi:hypothetical protein